MTGTLELLCGPSGVGKSSNINNSSNTPMTYTTRKPRNDKDAKTRRFVDTAEFDELVKNGEIVVNYEYDGNKYGFSKDIQVALQNDTSISEQIVPCDAALEVEKYFSKYGFVNKRLFLCDIGDIIIRLGDNRTPDEAKRRGNMSIDMTKNYLKNIHLFDDFQYNYPKKLINKHVENIVKSVMDKKINSVYEAGFLIDEYIIQMLDDENLRKSMLINPFLYDQIRHISYEVLQQATTSDITFRGFSNFDKLPFSSIMGFAAITSAVFGHEEGYKMIIQKMTELAGVEDIEKIESNNPVLAKTQKDLMYVFDPKILTEYVTDRCRIINPDISSRQLLAISSMRLLAHTDELNLYAEYLKDGVDYPSESEMIYFDAPSLLAKALSTSLELSFSPEYYKYIDIGGDQQKRRERLTGIFNWATKGFKEGSEKLFMPRVITDNKEKAALTITAFIDNTSLANNINGYLWYYCMSYNKKKHDKRPLIEFVTKGISINSQIGETPELKYLIYNTNNLVERMAILKEYMLTNNVSKDIPIFYGGLINKPSDIIDIINQKMNIIKPLKDITNELMSNYSRLTT